MTTFFSAFNQATSQVGNFKYNYENNPIIFEQGIAQNMPNGVMSIGSILQNFNIQGTFLSSTPTEFAKFYPLSGSTLAEWQIAEYPFANMQMAANAVIQMPLKISLIMVAPAQNPSGYINKTNQFTSLQNTIQNHIQSGGYFTVLTPAYIYSACLLRSIRDITPSGDKQVQFMYQWDFEQPLITQQAAQQVLGTFMSRASNGQPTPQNVNWNSSPATIADPNSYNYPNSTVSLPV